MKLSELNPISSLEKTSLLYFSSVAIELRRLWIAILSSVRSLVVSKLFDVLVLRETDDPVDKDDLLLLRLKSTLKSDIGRSLLSPFSKFSLEPLASSVIFPG